MSGGSLREMEATNLWFKLPLSFLAGLHVVFVHKVSSTLGQWEIVGIRILVFAIRYEIAVYCDIERMKESDCM